MSGNLKKAWALGALMVLASGCAKLPVINETPVSLGDGTQMMADHLMQQMPRVWLGDKNVFIKPFPDADSGQVNATSREIEIILINALNDSGDYEAERMRSNSWEESDYVIGGIIRYEPDASGTPRYHLIANAIQSSSREVVAQSDIWLTEKNLDYTATPSSEDSPVFASGKTLKQQVSIVETPVDVVLSPLDAQFLDDYGMVVEAQTAYDEGAYEVANRLYQELTQEKSFETPETYGGLYTSYLKLDDKVRATESFSRLVATAAEDNIMPFKFQFASGSTAFLDNPLLREQYPIWLTQIAKYFEQNPEKCLNIHGHSSKSGTREGNLKLSTARSAEIERQLKASFEALPAETKGFGPDQCKRCTVPDSSENAIDRRVEFVVQSCAG